MIYNSWTTQRKARAVKQMSDYLLKNCYLSYTTWRKYCPYWKQGKTETEYFEDILEFVSQQGNFEKCTFCILLLSCLSRCSISTRSRQGKVKP